MSERRSARRVALTVGLSFLVVTAACTAATSDGAPAPTRGPLGGTLRLGMANPVFWGMDPRDEWNEATWELFRCCLLRTMMSYDLSGETPDLRPIPDLAAEPPEISADGRTWTFRLREDVHYAPPLDDVAISSGDFVRAITRAAASFDEASGGGLASYLDMIEGYTEYVNGGASSIVGLQTPDAHTLVVTTTRLDSTLLYLFTMPITAPIPAYPGSQAEFGVATDHDMTPQPDGGAGAYGRVLVSSGPYMYEGAPDVDYSLPPRDRVTPPGFVPWEIAVDDSRVSRYGSFALVRNPSWRAEDDPLRAALPDRIEVTGGPPDALFSMMESSELDLVFDADAPRELIATYQEEPTLRPLVQTPIGARGLIFATFNVARRPFDDLAVRKAVAYAMDRIRLAELAAGPDVRVAEHFGLDTFEASLLAPWAGFPGDGGHGDLSAAHAEMERSRYASNDRCVDPACRGVPITILPDMEPALGDLRAALRALGIRPDFRLNPDVFFECIDPQAPPAMCIGLGWLPDFPSAAQYLGSLFAHDGGAAVTRLGSTPAELEGWGYEVTRVPSLDDRIERCERELGAGQAPCWARLDQYAVTQLMPAVPLGFFGTVQVSSPSIGPFPWNQILLVPALDRTAPAASVGPGPPP